MEALPVLSPYRLRDPFGAIGIKADTAVDHTSPALRGTACGSRLFELMLQLGDGLARLRDQYLVFRDLVPLGFVRCTQG
jgi:hypothetical protein